MNDPAVAVLQRRPGSDNTRVREKAGQSALSMRFRAGQSSPAPRSAQTAFRRLRGIGPCPARAGAADADVWQSGRHRDGLPDHLAIRGRTQIDGTQGGGLIDAKSILTGTGIEASPNGIS